MKIYQQQISFTSTLFYFFCYLNQMALSSGNKRLNVSALVNTACGYNSFCEADSKPLPEGRYSCCAECSCTDDCYIGNRCCPGFPVNGLLNTGRTCKPQSEYFDAHRKDVIIDSGYGSSYYVIDSCQEGYNIEIVNGCLHPETLEDHVFVSDSNSTTIYKNSQCAVCNGIQKYETWKVTVFCKYNDAVTSHDKRQEYILKHCSLVSEPPTHLLETYRVLICSPSTIDACNVTGEWNFYDRDLEHACSEYDMLYREEYIIFGKIIRSFRIYRNIFCFLCNKNYGTVAQSTCLGKIETSGSGKESTFGSAPFTAVLDLRHADEPGERFTCRIDETKEPLLDTCTKLFCPFGKTAFNGVCIEDIKYLYVTLTATFKLEFGNTPQTSNAKDEMIDALLGDISRKFNMASCGLCEVQLYKKGFMFIRSVPRNNCTLPKLLKIYEYFSKVKILQINFSNGRYDVHIKQEGLNTKDILQLLHFSVNDYISPDRSLYNQRCPVGAHLKPKFYCEHIVYSINNLEAGGISNETIVKLLQFSEPRSNISGVTTDYVICLRDYRGVENAASLMTKASSMIFFLVMLMRYKF